MSGSALRAALESALPADSVREAEAGYAAEGAALEVTPPHGAAVAPCCHLGSRGRLVGLRTARRAASASSRAAFSRSAAAAAASRAASAAVRAALRSAAN